MFGVLTELRRYAADVLPTAVGACCRRRLVDVRLGRRARRRAMRAVTPHNASRPDRSVALHRDKSPRHAVCITGLERSFPEISHNIQYALSTLYAGVRQGSPGTTTAFQSSGSSSSGGGGGSSSQHRAHGPRSSERAMRVLERSVAFFGVRPVNDSWASVRTNLPPLHAESIQTPCGPKRPPW